MEAIIAPSEVEFYIDTMQPHSIKKIASNTWVEWHQRLQKLHQQAILEASQVKEEHVKETLVTCQKVDVLVYEAIVISTWKNKILPHIIKGSKNQEGTFVIYTVLYHEIVVLGLLELVLFHGDGAESLGDHSGDLLDYAYTNATKILQLQYQDTKTKESLTEEICRHKNNISLEVSVKCITILRYFSEHLDVLPVGITNQIYNTFDVPYFFIQLLLQKPWLQGDKQYVNGQFIAWDGESLCQIESQVWLGLHQLLLNKLSATYYPITENRKAQIIKILPLMSPVILDQVSPLLQLKDALCRIAMSSERPSAPPKPVLIEVMLEIKEGVLKEVQGVAKKLAAEQAELIFTKDKNKLVEMAKTLSDAYNTDFIEKFEDTKERPCVKCGKNSRQKCSRCKNAVYCSKSCQVEDWNSHKSICVEYCA